MIPAFRRTVSSSSGWRKRRMV